MLTSIVLIVLGLLSSFTLFLKFPKIEGNQNKHKALKISVIIPARNEGKTLPLLLNDLNNQSFPAYEVICVDDCSTDDTGKIISESFARLVSVKDKPSGWLGKSWACQEGARIAHGDLFLFLDADVRLNKNAVLKLVHAYTTYKCTLSVLPYHKTEKKYEQLSMFFNLIQFAANGSGMRKGRSIGLYGPVILIDKSIYREVGGHEKIRKSVIDDVALGIELNRANIPFKLFLGDSDIRYRMYPSGFGQLFQGWLKNIASGAVKTPIIRFVMIFLWVTSCLSVFLNLIFSIIGADFLLSAFFAMLYLAWVVELTRIAPKIGNFSPLNIILFPFSLLVFLIICLLSAFKKVFRLKTSWKGRKV